MSSVPTKRVPYMKHVEFAAVSVIPKIPSLDTGKGDIGWEKKTSLW